MKLKKEYIFIIINYSIFMVCWILFESGIALMDNKILGIIGLVNLLIHTILIFGGEGVIYFIYSSKNDSKVVLKVLLISLCINMCINIITSVNAIIAYLTINQIIGFVVGRICYKRKH